MLKRLMNLVLGLVFLVVALGAHGLATEEWSQDETEAALHEVAAAIFGAVGAIGVLSALTQKNLAWGRKAKAKLAGALLDQWLLMWSPRDGYRLRDLLNGGVCILGRAGSGKTSSSGLALARGIAHVRDGQGRPASGGLILGAKPEDLAMWRGIFAHAGRRDDLLVFSPASRLRFNFVDYLTRLSGGHTRNIVSGMMIMAETLERGENRNESGDAQWFRQQTEMQLHYGIDVVKMATGRLDIGDLNDFISDAAQDAAQLKDEKWRKGIHCQMLAEATQRARTPNESYDIKQAVEFHLGKWPNYADRTKSAIAAGTNRILFVFNSGLIRQVFGGATNTTPEDQFRGRFWFSDFSPSEHGAIGGFASAGLKYLTQRAVLRREAGEGDCVNVTWIDEYPLFVNSFDQQYIQQSRSHLGCMVTLAQSVPSFYAALPGEKGEHQAQALLANFTHAVVHTCDPVTAQWASSRLGQELQVDISGSEDNRTGLYDQMMGNGGFRASFSEHMRNILEPAVFMNNLRSGGPENGFIADAIVLKSGMPFSNGQNWLPVSFSQR